jgi:aromatic-L-amino-acid/L-tryptophan decarboxylase
MPPEEFRTWGHVAVDWIADYLARVETLPVLSRVRPGEFRRSLPPRAPEEGESPEALLRDFQEQVVPALTHWNHPAFFGYFSVTGSGPGILGEMLAAAVNVNAMVWRSSPAGTELEAHVLDWLRELLGLPPGHFGVIQDTASVSSMVALAAARHRAWPRVREEGLSGLPRGRIYASVQAHSSIEKAAIALGLGHHGVRKVETDAEFRMDPEALRTAIQEDLAAGVRPVAVVATVGTTSTTSVDPVAPIAGVAGEFGVWLHVDAAYAGAAAVLPEMRAHFQGWEGADSIVVNPHKWLFTPVDCSVLYTPHREELREAFALTPEYLRTPEMDQAHHLMDYGVALGRRFRALKLWFVLRYFGAEGIRGRIREHLRLARRFADQVDAEAGWERVAPVPFSTIVFRFVGGAGGEDPQEEGLRAEPPQTKDPRADGERLDLLNQEIMDRVNASGEAFLSHTRLNGRLALRVAIGHLNTEWRHLERSWELLREAAAEVGGPAAGPPQAPAAGPSPAPAAGPSPDPPLRPPSPPGPGR